MKLKSKPRKPAPSPVPDDLRVLNVGELEQCLGLCHQSVYRLMQTGELPSVKMRGRRGVRVSVLRDYLEQSERRD
jgi:predicted DNA-binding transcriptional regulator AlpA